MRETISSWFKRYFSEPEAISIILIIASVFVVLNFMSNIFSPIIVAVIVACLLSAIVKKLERWKFPHLLAVSFVFCFFMGILVLMLFWLLPLLWQELYTLLMQFPEMLSRGQTFLLDLNKRYPELISLIHLQQFITNLGSYLANIGKTVVAFSVVSIVNVVTIIVYLVLMPLLVFFFLRDGAIITGWFKYFLPNKRHAMVKIWNEVKDKIERYIRGKIIECVIVALISILVFYLLGLNYAALLGALVGISVIIPYIGFVLVSVPIVIVAFIQWGFAGQFLYLLLVHFIIAILDANILVPMLFAGAMALHPVAIILAVMVFGCIGGFWGVFFAIPLATLVNALIKHWPRTAKL